MSTKFHTVPKEKEDYIRGVGYISSDGFPIDVNLRGLMT
jgi:hypothetical protein